MLFLAMLLVVTPAFGQLLSDKTGLVSRLDVEAGGHYFEVQITSNFYITKHTFDKDHGLLTLYLQSSLEDNLGEVIIPLALLGGSFDVFLNDNEIHPVVRSNDQISFITLNFTGSGDHRIDIFGDAYIGGTQTADPPEPAPGDGGGCLIATAAYGSELASEVQALREIRDARVNGTHIGASFVSGFSQFYYAVSPHVADYQRENPAFNEMVRIMITPLVASLGIMSAADSESKVLLYGMVAILANVGMYLAAPMLLFACVVRLFTR